MRNYIILNGNNSNNITGLLIQSLAPITKPAIRTTIEEIDGRDGDIVTPLGYGAYDKEISIGLYGSYNVDDVIAFFNNNKSGKATFSNEDDKYYNYEIYEQIDFDRLIRFKTATVKMHVQPFKYPTTETEKEIEAEFIEDTGTNLSLNNTTEAPLDIELLPDTQQDTTIGYNLWHTDKTYPIKPIQNQSITLDYDEQTQIYTLNGGGASVYFYIYTGAFENFNVGDKVLIKFEKISGTATGTTTSMIAFGGYHVETDNNGWVGYLMINFSDLAQNYKTSVSTLDKLPMTEARIWVTSANTSFDNFKFRILFAKSDDTSLNWEPYTNGASPNPNYPQPIQVVTGNQTITISNNDNTQSQTYTLTLGTLEYRKINDVSDRIFKNVVGDIDYDSSRELGKWYIKKNIGKYTFTGNETFGKSGGRSGEGVFCCFTTNITPKPKLAEYSSQYGGYFNRGQVYNYSVSTGRTNNYFAYNSNNSHFLSLQTSSIPNWDDSLTDEQKITLFKNYLANNLTKICYLVETPTYELLNDTLQGELNALENAMSYNNQTNVNSSGDLPIIIDATAMKDGTNEGTVKNTGNIYAKPVLDIEGNGIVGVYLNGIQLFNIDLSETNEIVIDTANLEAYNPNTTQLMNRKVTGNYENFKLLVGDNTIKFTGYFTKATITNYTRWL